jgi:hypothetical protein
MLSPAYDSRKTTKKETPMRAYHQALTLIALFSIALVAPHAEAQSAASGQKWVTTWAASAHGPYPIGNPSAQPEQKFAFPVPTTGAEDQTFRLIVKPDLWGGRMRLRFSNVHGTKPVVIDAIYIGMQASAGNLVPGTNRPVTFDAKEQATIAPGKLIWSDPVDLPYAREPGSPALAGAHRDSEQVSGATVG